MLYGVVAWEEMSFACSTKVLLSFVQPPEECASPQVASITAPLLPHTPQ